MNFWLKSWLSSSKQSINGLSLNRIGILEVRDFLGELILETSVLGLGIKQNIGLKIKIEVDTKPPLGFETEEKLLLQPYSFCVKCFVLEDLFAGKMHALLFRKWNNVRGVIGMIWNGILEKKFI